MRVHLVRRLGVIFFALFLFAILIVVRLYFVQIVHGAEYVREAESQYVRPDDNLYDRGSIFFTDRNGRLVSAATLQSGYVVAIHPNLIEDPELVYERLQEYVVLDHDAFIARATKENDPYEEVATHVPAEVAGAIADLSLPGVDVYPERWRYYPGGDLAAQSVGFVAYKGDLLTGQYGLERSWNDTLKRSGGGMYVNFFAEVFSDISDLVSEGTSSFEGDVVTSIEPSVQSALDKELKAIASTWHSREVGGIVMDPKTGAIYGLGVYPRFDLNDFREESDVNIFSNPLVENVYEMGSIVKPLTMAAGLDTGVITTDTTYNDTGTILVNGARVSNFDGRARGVVPMQEVLNQSLNIGAAFIERKLGNERFAEYMKAYGLGEKTGIDLPNESTGIINNLESPRDIEYVTASFGQGIAMSPIAITRALAALANGGVLPSPHLATEIRYTNGLKKAIKPVEGRRVISQETSEAITRMLVTVVDEALAGGRDSMDRYSIAAKTGTAQIADSHDGGYYTDRYLHSFFGYFPAYEPRFIVFLYNLEPVGAKYASQTLTDPFMHLTHFLVNYYDLPPDR